MTISLSSGTMGFWPPLMNRISCYGCYGSFSHSNYCNLESVNRDLIRANMNGMEGMEGCV